MILIIFKLFPAIFRPENTGFVGHNFWHLWYFIRDINITVHANTYPYIRLNHCHQHSSLAKTSEKNALAIHFIPYNYKQVQAFVWIVRFCYYNQCAESEFTINKATNNHNKCFPFLHEDCNCFFYMWTRGTRKLAVDKIHKKTSPSLLTHLITSLADVMSDFSYYYDLKY